MEKYTFTQKGYGGITIMQGEYYNKIYAKHAKKYGDFGAENIRENIISTFEEALKQTNDTQVSNNMLLVGKVQSGKTSNLELFTALAFDNGFNMVVIYGGYDDTLLSQTMNRFKKTFDIPNDIDYSDPTPVIFSSDDGKQLLSVDNEIIEDLLAAKKPIFLISMKRPAAMSKVNDLLGRIGKTKLKAFIIDDEGDQASLNTKKNKAKDASATYAEIVRMKDLLSDPLYLSVTATPQANIFLDNYSRLRPDSIRLIEPGKGYCGAEAYHLFDSDVIEPISDEDQNELTNGSIPVSLKNAIYHYIVASAIMSKRGRPMSDMIIHSHRNVNDHSAIYRSIEAFIQAFKDDIEFEDEENLNVRLRELKKCYNKYFSSDVKDRYPFKDLKDIICKNVVSRIYIILKNSAGKVTQATEAYRKHKIYIGGDLLQRGVTFDNLVTTYFLRWANDGGNMDTNLQRARWFGYREDYIDLCKIFTSESISREFTNLSEMESDLWEQFYAIQNSEMSIDDILIHAGDTKQRPTRKNVANYHTVSFKNKWIKQRVGVFDSIQISENNQTVIDLIGKLQLSSTNAGRRDGAESAKYAIVDKNTLTDLIDKIQAVFDLEPFEKKSFKDLIKDEEGIPVIFMRGYDSVGRERSFYQDNKIYALHQGADNKDKEKAVYLGDSFVVVDRDKVNIQIHKIIPKRKTADGTVMQSEYTQYMFAVYIPKAKKYYAKGD